MTGFFKSPTTVAAAPWPTGSSGGVPADEVAGVAVAVWASAGACVGAGEGAAAARAPPCCWTKPLTSPSPPPNQGSVWTANRAALRRSLQDAWSGLL